MRILLQQKETGLYFKDVGSWTRMSVEAMDFVSSTAAIDFCAINKLTGRTMSYFSSSNLRTSWTPESLLIAQKSIAAVELTKSMASTLMRVQEPTSLKYRPVSFC